MKILFFNYEYPPLGGGAGNAAMFLLREYSQTDDLEVDFVTSSADNDYHLDKIGKQIRIHRLPIGKEGESMHFQTKKDLIMYSWKAFWFSRGLMKKNKYDLTHSFFTIPCGALSFYFKIFKKVPYIISLRGSDVPGYSERFDKLYKFIGPLVKRIWINAGAVIANSAGLRELALETYSKKEIGLIPNGIDVKGFDPDRFEKEREEKQSIKIICGTRVTPRKGFRFLVDAVKILKEQGEDIQLDIIGEGNEKEDLEARVNEKKLGEEVKFFGFVDHTEIPALLSKADVFVSPALNEGMANFMLEALAMGLPMVITDTGGTAELLDNGVNGLMIKQKNAEDIAEKIKVLIDSSEKRKRMSVESRKKSLNMSWERVARKYREVYEKSLQITN